MSNRAPLVDPRRAVQLAADVTAMLRANVPDWSPTDPETGEEDQATAALINTIARFGEIVIERLNRAPDKHFLAFLDLLGTAPLPPEPARVPLTFAVAAGSTTDAVVPAGTRVAAAPAEGEVAPVVFETERELTAVAASLRALIAVDAERDLIGDHSALLAAPAPNGVHAFTGDRQNEHVLYVAHDSLLSNARLSALTITVQANADTPTAPDPRTLQWEVWDGATGVPLTVTDTTEGLRVSGAVSVANLTQVPQQTVNGIRSRWLRCRLMTPISPGTTPVQGMARAAQMPLLAEVRVSASIARAGLVPDVAFVNGQAVDVSRAFHPFGERPKVGDTLFIGHREALGQPGGSITIDAALVNPIPDAGGDGASSSIRVTTPSNDLQLKWEVWDGAAWALLGVTTPTGSTGGALVDDGRAFTKSRPVRFTLPASLGPTTVNGVESNWIRVQIAAGNYGVDAELVSDETQPGGVRLVLATFAPPVVNGLALSYDATTSPVAPDAVVAFNNAQFQDLSPALAAGRAAPFAGFPSQPAALHMAFALPASRTTFPNRAVSLYLGVRLPPYGEAVSPSSGGGAQRRRELRLEYWNGAGWSKLIAADGTDRLTRPGVVEFLGPADFAPSSQFGISGFWVRVLLEPGDEPPVQLRSAVLNTTFATQTVTFRNEVLGSSDASANQRFRTTHSPVLARPQLEVREPASLASAVWVPWIEVTDFHGSTPHDRHYVADHLTGEVRFGDGVQGRIPPRGVGNVRMTRYQTGGGASGNRGAGTVVQLRTTVPYIESVTNIEPAEGGVSAETTAALIARAPRALRHGGRAVAPEDYEDLARAASPEVVRAKAVPLRNLRVDPLSNDRVPGVVSVVIVPLSVESKPLPSVGLMALVEKRLRSCTTPTAAIAVVGPVYVRVDVSVEIALLSLEGASAVEVAVRNALRGFLHPLTGGRDGTGWDFGRRPFLSDLYAVVSAVPGVDHVRQLDTNLVEDMAGVLGTERFLVHSGQHQIALTFVGPE